MIKYAAFVIALLVALAPPSAFAQADEGVIGTVLEVEGNVSLTPAGGQPAAAKVNMPVHLNDVVQTGIASRAFILFIDNTQLTLSENAQVTVDNYVYDPDDNTNNKASYSVLQGAFQYVSGLIGKKDNPDVHIDTPVGSIGIRGTDFWAGNLDNQYSVAVNEGQVALKTEAGEQVVNKGEGTSVRDRYSLPLPAQAWDADKFQRIAYTVHLQRQALVRWRMRAMQGRQVSLRNNYKSYMARHGYVSGQQVRQPQRFQQPQQAQENLQKHSRNKKQRRHKAWCSHHPKLCARQREEKNN